MIPKRTRANRGGRDNVGGQHNFANIPNVSMPRSRFQRNNGYKTTFDAGFLIPIFTDEVLPGDTINMTPTYFCRLATPLHPVMDQLHLDTFWFAVPLRLLWVNFKRFMGEQDDPADSIDFEIPQITTPNTSVATLEHTVWDYMGLPVQNMDGTDSMNALFFRAYNLIYQEWFRDENLVDGATIITDDGPDQLVQYPLQRRGKRKDYFTSSLPWPQKGDAVELPLGSSAPIVSDGTNPTMDFLVTPVAARGVVGDELTTAYKFDSVGGGSGGTDQDLEWVNSGLQADLSAATASTINNLREAFQIQRMAEKDARGGTRYTELVQSHFQVSTPDARQQRPEFLGGASQPLFITPLPQTSETNGTDALGDLAGVGIAGGTARSFSYSATEHAVIIGIASVRADLNYQEVVARQWDRLTKFDFYWPSLAHIGEQAVKNQEIYYDPGDALNDLTFGYQERWAEYRYKPSLVTGRMRSISTVPLDTWHLAQDFGATRPVLNEDFIQEDPPVDRIIAVTSEPHFKMDCYFEYACVRPMPTFSVPGLIDHF